MAYTKTVWVNSTAPGISSTNLNNLETQYDESVSYYQAQISTSYGLAPSSVGAIGTSTHWAPADHRHQYGTSTQYAGSTTGSILACTIPANHGGTYIIGGTICRRAGTYTVHMMREGGGSSHTLHIYKNGVTQGNAVLATTTEMNVGNVTFTAGDTIVCKSAAANTATDGIYFTLLYNSDGWF